MLSTEIDLAFQSATALTARLRSREISSCELLRHYRARIERFNPAVNAVVTLDERAFEQAAAADAALARGESWGPLHGLPITIKDSLETAGLRTTAGAPEYAAHVPTRDADAVARLRAAGAIIFGKTNLPAYAADCQTFNPIFGTTRNPWNLERAVGGSSGGAAAAVAAGLTGLDLGSDLGGSIRNPAGYCGVYGLRPSYGIIPTRGHVPGPPGSLAELDMATVGSTGPRRRRPGACPRRSGGSRCRPLGRVAPESSPSASRRAARLSLRDLAGRRVLSGRCGSAACAEQRGRPTRARRRARGRGASVLAARSRTIGAAIDPGGVQWGLSSRRIRASPRPRRDRCSRRRFTTVRHARNVTVRSRDLSIALEARAQLAARCATFFTEYDVLLCPITPTTAIPHDHQPDVDARRIIVNGMSRPYGDQIPWASLPGVCGLPAVVLPAGLARDGLPVGLQVIGPFLADRTVIDVAGYIGELVGGFVSPPGY